MSLRRFMMTIISIENDCCQWSGEVVGIGVRFGERDAHFSILVLKSLIKRLLNL